MEGAQALQGADTRGSQRYVFAAQWRAASDDGVRLRAVIDQVASLTDVSASAWHARWCGMLSSQL